MSTFQATVTVEKSLTRILIEGDGSGPTALVVEGGLRIPATDTLVRSYRADLTSSLSPQDIATIQSFWTRAQNWLDSQPNT
jgi:hypothetical protein